MLGTLQFARGTSEMSGWGRHGDGQDQTWMVTQLSLLFSALQVAISAENEE